MRIWSKTLPVAAILLALAGCAKHKGQVATAPPAPAAPPVARAMPRPPLNAAPNLNLPQATADGSFATPSRGLSDAGNAWHLRAALNVAVLQCAHAGDPMETQYNSFLKTQKVALAKAHDALKAEYRKAHGGNWQDRFDDEMTRLYNFYAQPPARAGFCAAAAPMMQQAAAIPSGGLSGFAAPTLAALDVPFTDFYRAYAAYRSDLAAWQAGQTAPTGVASVSMPVPPPAPRPQLAAASSAAPRLTVDRAVLMSDASVTTSKGRIQFASR